MNELHLFSGSGGGILGGMLLGHTCVCAVEINPYCRKTLLQRQRDGMLPKFPIWDDIRTFDPSPWRGLVDIVCGGFPCQRFSTATRGEATAEDLWPEMLRVVEGAKPNGVFAENVSRRAIEIAAEDLQELGYASKAVKISASDVGADHVRARYWLLAHADMHSKLSKPFNAEMAVVPEFRPRVWDSFPDKLRMAHGVANRVDRIRAIGNGQLPAVVEIAWKTLVKQ